MPSIGKPKVLNSHRGVLVKSHGARKAKRVRARIRPIVMAMAYQLELILKRDSFLEGMFGIVEHGWIKWVIQIEYIYIRRIVCFGSMAGTALRRTAAR